MHKGITTFMDLNENYVESESSLKFEILDYRFTKKNGYLSVCYLQIFSQY